jgi:predicted nuclease of predicted toxin-antitoxin system
MSVPILVDMSLPPTWIVRFQAEGWLAVHWSKIGAVNAEDSTILSWARTNGYAVFTHDLDFGTLLALTRAVGPSVVQIRTQDVLPQAIGNLVVSAIRQHESQLARGALLVIEEAKSRVRILPLTP